MELLGRTIITLDRRRPDVLAQLHPDLLPRILAILTLSNSKLTPWQGYRTASEQRRAKALGHSAADWGQSPHNFLPALACDPVLDPRFVPVRPSKSDPRYPDLWDDETPEAAAVWSALDGWAEQQGLERVTLAGGRPDLPHLQLLSWRSYISATSAPVGTD